MDIICQVTTKCATVLKTKLFHQLNTPVVEHNLFLGHDFGQNSITSLLSAIQHILSDAWKLKSHPVTFSFMQDTQLAKSSGKTDAKEILWKFPRRKHPRYVL